MTARFNGRIGRRSYTPSESTWCLLDSRLVFLEDDLFWEFAKLVILYKGEKFFRHFLETQRAKYIILYIVLAKN